MHFHSVACIIFFTGFLCNNKIYNDMKEKQIERIFDNLEKENFEFFYR